MRRDVGQIRQQQRDEPVLMPLKSEAEQPKVVEPDPREALSYNDVEILRALADGNFVYGNLVSICETTGLSRELVSQRLTIMKAMGAEPLLLGIAGDDKELIKARILEGLHSADIVVTTGGVSVGDYDFVEDALKELNVETLFYKVNQKPGKPLLVGKNPL